jgi:hypothetical protein
MVYSHVLEFNELIELWAETGDVYADRRRRRENRTILRRRFGKNEESNLGLLRTCKQVNTEAAELFYGKNEFRFSGINGHMAAWAFVSKIGRHNLNFIKSITLSMPFWSVSRGMYGENWNPDNGRRIHELYNRRPFPCPATEKRDMHRYPRLNFENSWRALSEARNCSSTDDTRPRAARVE